MGRREGGRPFYLTVWYTGSSEERRATPANTFVRGEGMTLVLEDGRTLEDWTGQACVNNIGLGRPEVAKALADASMRLSWLSPGEFAEERLGLTEDLLSVLPHNLRVPFYNVGGSDSIEIAIRAARRVTERKNVLTFDAAYHGDTMTTEHVSGTGMTPYGDPRPWVVHAPSPYTAWRALGDWDRAYEAVLDGAVKALRRRGPRTFAALILEPVMYVAGAVPFSRDLARGLRELCDQHDVKLVSDEVATGFGRTGRWFGAETIGVKADAMTLAKGLTGGYAPLGATVFERSWGAELRRTGFPHGLTFGGHPLGCVAARETIRILKSEGLVERSARMGAYLKKRLGEVRNEHDDLVHDVRGHGLLVGFELHGPRRWREKDRVHPAWKRVKRVSAALRKDGMKVSSNADGSTIVLCPPFIVTEAQVDRLAGVLSDRIRQG